MSNQVQFKVADSIAVDDDGYAKATLASIEFDQYTDSEGEITEQILFQWETKTRKGVDTKLRFWTGLNINPTPRSVNGKTTYNALTQLLLIHQIISVSDLKKLAQNESYINELEIDLEKMIGQSHKFKLNTNERGLAKPDIPTLKVVKALSIGVSAN